MMRDAIEQFRHAIRIAGLNPPDVIETDGKPHRFSTNGRRSDDAGWYVYHANGIPAGVFGDWRTDFSQTWRADIGRALSPAEQAEHRERVQASQREREAARAREQAEAANEAARIWEASTPAPENHPYLLRKGTKPHGVRLHNGALVIPMRADGEIQSLQFIGEDGKKRFLPGGRVTGCYFIIGNPGDAAALCIAEGFATYASVHEATGYAVAVAFNAGNLVPVAKAMRERFTKLQLILCSDDDVATDGNPGITKAAEAARAVDGLLATPVFGTSRPPGVSDFNDMAAFHGLEAVKQAIASAAAPDNATDQCGMQSAPGGDFEGWGEPLPLVAKVAAEPYPLDALPDGIRAAIEEVQAFTKAPIALVASSALGALSLTIQAHVDVRRDEMLFGPVSLFLLTIADSGERKTQADKMFTRPIQDYQDAQAEAGKVIWKDYKAKLAAWESKCGGIKDKIRQLAKSNKPTADLESSLRDLEHQKPEPPRVPKLMREDATPEGLAKKLQQDWPSAGVISNEAGIVFGAHGMGKESVMRNLALLNKLWDGGRYQSDRGDEQRSRDVRGARLTMGLMIQESTLRAFFDQSKGLGRGSGFLARFLVAWPESTMGTRFYTAPVEGGTALTAFNRRITELLYQAAPIDGDGVLTPHMLALTPDATAAWIKYYNAIERELATGGELYDVRDVASKSADNTARLAALFHVFGSTGSNNSGSNAISAEHLEAASRVVAWHLNESRRFFGELALPVDLANAVRN
jgi:putative DNA primase/helicase